MGSHQPRSGIAPVQRARGRAPTPASLSAKLPGIHPPLERSQQLRGPAAKLCQGGSVTSPVAAAGGTTQPAAFCPVHPPTPRGEPSSGAAPRSPPARDSTTTPGLAPLFAPGPRTHRRPALAAARPRPGLSRVPGAGGINGHGAAGLGSRLGNPPNPPAGPDTSGSGGRIPAGMHRGQLG